MRVAVLWMMLVLMGCVKTPIDNSELAAQTSQDLATTNRLVAIDPINEEQFNHVLSLAEQDNPVAQYQLGLFFAFGQGVGENQSAAAEWYTKAAEAGLPEAQHNLGLMLLHGTGVGRNKVKAHHWMKKSAEQGFAPAQFNLSLMYKTGEGVEAHPYRAVIWALEAAKQGYRDAQYNLATWYGTGRDGIPLDHEEAFKWYREAAIQGSQNAIVAVSMRYLAGVGVKQDIIKAYGWITLADAEGAKPYEDLVLQKISESQLQEARLLINECSDSFFEDC